VTVRSRALEANVTNILSTPSVAFTPSDTSSKRRRILDRKRPASAYERREVHELYFSDHLAVWAIARMTGLSRKAVADIVNGAPVAS
jgi:hypothetical protein